MASKGDIQATRSDAAAGATAIVAQPIRLRGLIIASDGGGAGAAPRYIEACGKWTGSAQISDIELINQGSGNFKTGSTMKIYGAD